MSRAVVHEGASIWSWETAAGIVRKLRLEVSRAITPLTEELLDAVAVLRLRLPGDPGEVDHSALQQRVRKDVARPRHCPAGHVVVPYELRAAMTSTRQMLRVFPNFDGSPWPYIPIRFWLCPVCQAVYRQRELDDDGA